MPPPHEMPWCTTSSCAPAATASATDCALASTANATFLTSSPRRAIWTPLLETSSNDATSSVFAIQSVIFSCFMS